MDSVNYSYLDNLMTKDDEAFFKQLGQRIANLRKDQGLTQVQLAAILDCVFLPTVNTQFRQA